LEANAVKADVNVTDGMLPPSDSSSASKHPETCRMFENELLEKLSHIHPATPFVVFVPVVLWVLARGWMMHALGIGQFVGLFVAGTAAWTLAEYILHRWPFHWNNGTPFSKRVHFFVHGVHHDYPNDKTRLVMPLLMSVPLAFVFYFLFFWMFGPIVAQPFYAGFVTGYLCYDGTHYAVHHFKQRTRAGKYVRRHHMLHHFLNERTGFGVSSPFWDVIFRTMPDVKKPGIKRGLPSRERVDQPLRANRG